MSESANNFKSNKSYSAQLYNVDLKILDALYGPWDSLDEFIQTVADDSELTIEDVLEDIPQGLTLGIYNSEGKVEEWWNPELGKPFIKKQGEFGGDIVEMVTNNTTTLNQINETLVQMNQKITNQQIAQATDEWLIL